MVKNGKTQNFLGQYHHKLDFHNRLLLPSKLIVPGNIQKIVISKGFDVNILVLRTQASFEQFCDLFNKLNQNKSVVRKLQRHILSHTYELDIDKQNRIIIPKLLLNNAKLTKEITLIGVMDKIELWNTKDWGNEFLQTEKNYSAQLEAIDSYEK